MFPIRDHNPSHKIPFFTILIIIINALVFLWEITSPNLDEFIKFYALVPAQINFLQFETLTSFITSMFLHGGWLHIISNMWFLWIFGDNVEANLGHIKYIIFYLISGIAAAFIQYLIDPASTIPVLGASGAIAGVLGGYLVLFPHAKIETFVTFGFYLSRLNVPASIMLFYWFITQLFSGIGSVAVGIHNQGGVAFFAHIGGFAAGYLITKLFIKPNLNFYRIE